MFTYSHVCTRNLIDLGRCRVTKSNASEFALFFYQKKVMFHDNRTQGLCLVIGSIWAACEGSSPSFYGPALEMQYVKSTIVKYTWTRICTFHSALPISLE